MTGPGNSAPAIEAANQVFMNAFTSGDSAALASRYTSGGQLLPPQSPPVTGHAEIQAFWQSVMDMGIKDVKLETVEVEDHGASAVEVGKYTLLAEGGQLADAGKYLVVWRNEDGDWKLHHDIWNTSQPAT